MTTAADILEEYGEAFRGSWAAVDGRSVRSDLEQIASDMRSYGNGGLPTAVIVVRRRNLDLCPAGNGHWTEFCYPDCEEAP